MAKEPNYTPEVETALTEAYNSGNGMTVPELAEKFGKTQRSITSKLVRMGVYVAKAKGAATGKAEGPGKKELLRYLEESLPVGFPVDGLLPAQKGSLVALCDYLNEEFTGETTDEEEEAALRENF